MKESTRMKNGLRCAMVHLSFAQHLMEINSPEWVKYAKRAISELEFLLKNNEK